MIGDAAHFCGQVGIQLLGVLFFVAELCCVVLYVLVCCIVEWKESQLLLQQIG